MAENDTLDPQKVKKDSERIILAAGGRICEQQVAAFVTGSPTLTAARRTA